MTCSTTTRDKSLIRSKAHQSWTHVRTHQIWALAIPMYIPDNTLPMPADGLLVHQQEGGGR